jgi:hypothetical protein
MTNLINKFLLYVLRYSPPHVHVSSNILLILRRSNCINAASGIVTLSKWPFSVQVEKEIFQLFHLLRVTIPDVLIQLDLLRMINILLILRRSNCINTAPVIVTLSKWPFSAQVEKELFQLYHLLRVTIPHAVLIQFDLLEMSKILLETCTCRGL